MTWKRFEEIEAWQMARAFNQKIHELIVTSGIERHFALKDQMYRSAGSVMDNIAEGFERGSNGEFKCFLGYAKGSCGELRSQLYRCQDMGFLKLEQFLELKEEIELIAGKIFRIIEYLSASGIKGARFR